MITTDTKKIQLIISAIQEVQANKSNYLTMPQLERDEYEAIRQELEHTLENVIPRPTSILHHGGD